MPDNGVGRDTGPDRRRRRVWGRIEAPIYGVLGVPAVPHRSLKAVALEQGEVLAPALRPKKTLARAANVWTRTRPA